MTDSTIPLADRIDALKDEFADLDPRERLEFLVDCSHEMPPLPSGYAPGPQSESCRVQECMTPVYLWIDVAADRVQLRAHVAENAPTVKGFVALLVNLFTGATPAEVLSAPGGLLDELGLYEALGMQRQAGMQGVWNRIRREVATQSG